MKDLLTLCINFLFLWGESGCFLNSMRSLLRHTYMEYALERSNAGWLSSLEEGGCGILGSMCSRNGFVAKYEVFHVLFNFYWRNWQ